VKHLIRMDDFPHGDRNLYQKQKECYANEVCDIIEMFERHRVDYIWGVSPLLCNENHFHVLSDIHHGRIVMHGFSHGFANVKNWSNVTDCWRDGGEFSFFSEAEILERYEQCHRLLSRFSTYDPRHFIPPFNCYNQKLINVLDTKGVQWIHTCDQEWKRFNLDKIDHKNIIPIQSELYNSYDFVGGVLSRLDSIESQITLHWIYDVQRVAWKQEYEELARRVAS